MRPEIKALVELQAVDMRLAEVRGRLAALPQELAVIEKQAMDARQKLANAREALKSSAKDRKTFEMDVDAWKEKARKYRDQSLAVKTNEAYKALQHEIQYAESEVASAEDRLLERMVANEEFDRQIKSAEAALAEAERKVAGERQNIKAEQDSLRKELESKQAEREEKVAAIPANLLAVYERVANRRQHIGVAEIRDEACSLCGVRIRPHVFQAIRREDTSEIFQCETCTRIFYYVQRPPTPPAVDAMAEQDTGETSSRKA